MTSITQTRRSALNQLDRQHRKSDLQEQTIFQQLCTAIQQGKLIPVIGDAIRIGHIFDVNLDNDIGPIDDDASSTETEADADDLADLNIIEELAYYWGEDIGYPLRDRYRMARVAQWHTVDMNNAKTAKVNYLAFLKRTVLDVADAVADLEDDPQGKLLVKKLRIAHSKTFAEIVKEIDFPRFPEGNDDPLRVLARLPLRIYVTTSYHDFIEQALVAEDKHPRSRLCLWNMQPQNIRQEHRNDPSYEPDSKNPVVYHLLGMEHYPGSLVLSEDDYMDFLWKMADERNPPDDRGESTSRIIPSYLEAELNVSSLLLLGYRLQDWDFRVLFRGLLNANPIASQGRGPSVAIQINPEEQPLVEDESKTRRYLSRYFDDAKFRVHWANADRFVFNLSDAWNGWRAGGQS
jgi:hypothetical protein